MVMSFKAGNHLRFAEALVAISIYANAFAADAQVASIASTSGSASATPTPNLRVQVMPGDTLPLASHAPSLGPFEQEVTSLEDRRIEFSQRPIIFYGSSSIRRWKTLSQDFIGYPVVNCGFGGSRLSDCLRYVPPWSYALSLRRWSTQVITTWCKALCQTRRLPRSGIFTVHYAAIRSRCQLPISPSNRPRLGSGYVDNILRFNQMEAEAIIFALISPRNGYTQHERFVPESAEFQPFDWGALRHSYSAKDNSPSRPSDAKKSFVARASYAGAEVSGHRLTHGPLRADSRRLPSPLSRPRNTSSSEIGSRPVVSKRGASVATLEV
jgi:hypothetical protein